MLWQQVLLCPCRFFAGSASAESLLSKAVNSLVGTPYKYAGTSTRGFDCSGFTSYLFNKFGVDLPHSSKGQNGEGQWISKSNVRPGDLVFFFNTDGVGVSHVGVYVGNGKFAHSATKGGVTISSLDSSYYANRYVSARRVVWDDLYDQMMTDEN